MSKEKSKLRPIEQLSRENVFDSILKEMEISEAEIPIRFIDHIKVYYFDGTDMILKKEQLETPVPMQNPARQKKLRMIKNKIKEVKVYVNTEALEAEVNEYLNTNIYEPANIIY